MFSHSLLQAPVKEVSDWLSNLIVVKQPPDLEVVLVNFYFILFTILVFESSLLP